MTHPPGSPVSALGVLGHQFPADHRQFVTNLLATREALESALTAAWNANEPLVNWPRERTAELAASRYATVEW